MIDYKSGYLLEIFFYDEDCHIKYYDGLSEEFANLVFEFSSEFRGKKSYANMTWNLRIIDELFQKYGERFGIARDIFEEYVIDKYVGHCDRGIYNQVHSINMYYLPDPISPYLVKSI